ncbi:MAG: DUF4955 domain-containing protein [Bacteroidales bacterium]|nr:DUF4955 domain-containing protein [Bacteroidales bacterium]
MERHVATKVALAAVSVALVLACQHAVELDEQVTGLENRVAALQQAISATNQNALAIRALLAQETLIVGYAETESGIAIELSDNTTLNIFYGQTVAWTVPVLGIDADGRWCISLDGGQTFEYIRKTSNIHDGDGVTPQIGIDAEGYWTCSHDGGKTYGQILGADGLPISAQDGRVVSGSYSFFKNVAYDTEMEELVFSLLTGEILRIPVVETFFVRVVNFPEEAEIHLGETLAYEIEMSDIENALWKGPEGWRAILTDDQVRFMAPEEAEAGEYIFSLLVVSPKGFQRTYHYRFSLKAEHIDDMGNEYWKRFDQGLAGNVLLDFSYAGYRHGETAPPDAFALGYKIYDVMDYGAVPDDGKSDRDAFLSCLQDALGVGYQVEDDHIVFGPKEKANAVVYFPEGEYILHTSADDVMTEAGVRSREIIIRAGHLVFKGAGRDKTRILMQDPALPRNEDLYSSPNMIAFRNWSGLSDYTVPVSVTEDAEKGDFSVKVSQTVGVTKDSWVCLWAEVSDPEYVVAELAPYQASMEWDISRQVKIYDYHQVKEVSTDEVTFYEPLMHDVQAGRGFVLKKFAHYEGVGIEDITFAGNAKSDFKHHGSWQDDGGFKPLLFMRVTDSWVRRCAFESVSEAFTFHTSANCSGYDIRFTGWRGHAAMRSAASSRIFIGATVDETKGLVDATNPTVSGGTFMENVGQFHGVGVNGTTMGTVLWRNVYGHDSSFESHADQPRATLLDCCEGGWMEYRQGGGTAALPNHLSDLTIWNYRSSDNHVGRWSGDGSYLWWDTGSRSIKFLPPIIIGFHGAACRFNPEEVLVNESQGTAVEPTSLYEAQLRRRLGYIPAWLNSLK